MIKSILVALDDSRSGHVAQELAISTAKKHKAEVTGLAILNQPKPSSLGEMLRRSVESVTHAHEEEHQAALKRIEAEAKAFSERCAAEGVPCTPIAKEGEAYPFIATESSLHDLLVVGREHVAGAPTPGDEASIVKLLLQHSVRPLFLTPPAPPEGGVSVVVAYDGSAPSSRALQLFALLGLDEGREVHVVSIDDNNKVADALSLRAATYLRKHGMVVRPHGIDSGEAPADIIADKCKEVSAQMAVVGSMGHGGWRESLVGSSTLALLRFARIPLFISS